ncbi:hypothetical protein TUM20985_54060 [Mycobacterium antarcticum]|nr:hypothetical protein TUM20985_54060 [Mycolicibacterium sp. TUM20985]
MSPAELTLAVGVLEGFIERRENGGKVGSTLASGGGPTGISHEYLARRMFGAYPITTSVTRPNLLVTDTELGTAAHVSPRLRP